MNKASLFGIYIVLRQSGHSSFWVSVAFPHLNWLVPQPPPLSSSPAILVHAQKGTVQKIFATCRILSLSISLTYTSRKTRSTFFKG